jgi:flagellar biosynthesis/type III secretory pathway chaperone
MPDKPANDPPAGPHELPLQQLRALLQLLQRERAALLSGDAAVVLAGAQEKSRRLEALAACTGALKQAAAREPVAQLLAECRTLNLGNGALLHNRSAQAERLRRQLSGAAAGYGRSGLLQSRVPGRTLAAV